jgi:hypothetical protein
MNESTEVPAHSDRPARLTLRGFADSVQREVFDVDRGLLGTWLQLWRRPGATIRRYIEWRDPRVTPPVRYAIVCLALSALVLQWFGDVQYKVGFEQGIAQSEEGSGPAPSWARSIGEHMHWWLYLVAVPAMAGALESGYRARINWAEALAFATYLLAQISLGVVLLTALASKLPGYAGSVPLLLWPVYFAVACHGYFKPDGQGFGRALSTMVLMLALLLIFTSALAVVAIALGRTFG